MAVIELTEARGVDVIGDVHGHADALERLLAEMGYEVTDGVWRHPDRIAVFVGDLVDRGSQQVRTVEIVRAMVGAGAAHIVMGNHEFNAIAFSTPDPESPGEFLRPHTDKNLTQHCAFLDEVGHGSDLHRSLVEWFATIPLWLEIQMGDARLRVVHACWHQASMDALRPRLTDDDTLTPQGLLASSRRGTPEYDAVEVLLKGPEVSLGGPSYRDKDGHPRSRARVRWWNAGGASLRELALIPSGASTPEGAPFPMLSDEPVPDPITYDDEIPVVFGHYWRTGRFRVDTPYAGCVDYSVANAGPLVALRWNGATQLSDSDYVSVPGRP